jgi:hypothetical protein
VLRSIKSALTKLASPSAKEESIQFAPPSVVLKMPKPSPPLRLLYGQRQEIRDRVETLLDQMTVLGRENSELPARR